MANTSRSASQREALRRQQELEAKAARRLRFVGAAAGVVALIIVVVIVAAVLQSRKPAVVAQGAEVTPPNANADKTGILVNPDSAKAGVPTVTVFTDFQCSYCKPFELAYGPILEELAAAGDIVLDIRIKTQVDQILQSDSSTRAAVAASCADTVGTFHDYFMTVFANQPSEGTGFTDAQLRGDFASAAGITGDDLESFQTCYDNRSTLGWVINVQLESEKYGINGTPVVEVNGKRFEPRAFAPDRETILAEILKTAG